jgi:hypothetical protein
VQELICRSLDETFTKTPYEEAPWINGSTFMGSNRHMYDTELSHLWNCSVSMNLRLNCSQKKIHHPEAVRVTTNQHNSNPLRSHSKTSHWCKIQEKYRIWLYFGSWSNLLSRKIFRSSYSHSACKQWTFSTPAFQVFDISWTKIGSQALRGKTPFHANSGSDHDPDVQNQ